MKYKITFSFIDGTYYDYATNDENAFSELATALRTVELNGVMFSNSAGELTLIYKSAIKVVTFYPPSED